MTSTKTAPSDEELVTLAGFVRGLVDRNAVTDLISRLGLWLDEQRIDDMGEIFTDDVVGQLPGGPPFSGIETLKEHARRNLPQFERIQHVMTNLLIDLQEDRATVRANLIATHVHHASDPGSHFDFGGYYDFETVRRPEGWRICKVMLYQTWTGGTTGG